MKKYVSLFLILFAAIGLAAQSSGMPPGHQMLADPNKFADGHIAALDRQLHLSADQKAKMRPVFLDEGTQLFAVLNSNTLSNEQKQAAIGKLHTDTAAKVDSLLTPEQRRQYAPTQQMSHPASQT